MVIVRRWIVISLHRRKRDGSSGDGSVEDWRADRGQRYNPGFRGVGPIKIMEVSQDGDTQYAQRAGETVLGFGSTAFGLVGHTSGRAREERKKCLFSIVSTPFAV
ncbi:hypothetical protein DPMN_068346 [Dreissena polymorpha]|uniref:Uncharacterized protein n=1 Tax=Dreissena polymorpha TaxID=45954 RepID=A0A9D4BU80_DREPO|nr:hypothetical protein DPMN_068346 [Dreissena polymorpha]